MDELLPEDIIFNIFSRIPLKPLFRLRSVSKQWCYLIDHPCLAPMHLLRGAAGLIKHHHPIIPFILHMTHSPDPAPPPRSKLRLHMLQRHVTTSTSSSSSSSYKLQATDAPFLEYSFDNSNDRSFLDHISFGSCNGLVYFTQQSRIPGCCCGDAVIVSNPLRRISHKLSSFQTDFAACRKTYGLGFDSSNNTFKMVCVFSKDWRYSCKLSSDYAATLVQTLGTNTWREIPQVPPYSISGTPVYTRGFLHWKIAPNCFGDYDHEHNIEAMIVSFDVRKEEFKFTPHPCFHSKDSSLFQLLELNGNLAMVDLTFREIWVLKNFDQKYWVKKCRIPILAPGFVEVMGLSRDGEVLIKSNGGFFVYGPKTGLRYVQISCPCPDPSIYCFTGSLFSISNSMAENDQVGNGKHLQT